MIQEKLVTRACASVRGAPGVGRPLRFMRRPGRGTPQEAHQMDGRKSPARRPVTTRHNRLAGSGPVAVPGSDEGPPASRAGVRIPSFMTQRRRGMNGQWPLQDFLELGALVSAVPCARLHARQVLWEWGVLGSLGESTELLVAELVTNAVKASRAATKASCPARKQDWAGDLQAFLRQAARVYSLISPHRTGFRRICCVPTAVTVAREASRSSGMLWCGRAVL